MPKRTEAPSAKAVFRQGISIVSSAVFGFSLRDPRFPRGYADRLRLDPMASCAALLELFPKIRLYCTAL